MERARFAAELLSWEFTPSLTGVRAIEAEISAARYVIRGEPHEVLAWCEVRDTCGRRRIDIGSFPSVALARAACEADAAARCRRDDADECPPVSVAIAPGRRPAKAGKGRELAAGNYRPASAGELPDLDAVLAAFADVVGEEG